jgi:hypothetical protein
MCRNITTLRGLEPPATEEAFEQAVAAIARATAEVLGDLPPRRQPPKADPPLRRPEVRARMARS